MSVGGRVYVCGGSNGSQATATVWSIDPGEPGGTWREAKILKRQYVVTSSSENTRALTFSFLPILISFLLLPLSFFSQPRVWGHFFG